MNRIVPIVWAVVALAMLGCRDSTRPDPKAESVVARIVLQDSILTGYRNVELQLKATPVDRNQRPVSSPMTWSSSDTLVATVDAAGVVRPRALGTVLVTAKAGTASAVARITVVPDDVAPVISSMQVTDPVDLTNGDATVQIVAAVRDVGSGAATFYVMLVSEEYPEDLTPAPYWCSADRPATGTRHDGTFQCTIRLPGSALSGRWVASGWVTQQEGRMEGHSVPVQIQVQGSAPDAEGPAVAAVSISPDSVDVTTQNARVVIRVAATDSGAGVAVMELEVVDGATGRWFYHGIIPVDPGDGTHAEAAVDFNVTVLAGLGPARWQISYILLTDQRGNETRLTTEDLRAAGHPVQFTISRQ